MSLRRRLNGMRSWYLELGQRGDTMAIRLHYRMVFCLFVFYFFVCEIKHNPILLILFFFLYFYGAPSGYLFALYFFFYYLFMINATAMSSPLCL